MKAKSILAALLLLFVAASVAAWVVREFGGGPGARGASQRTTHPTSASSPAAEEASPEVSDKVVAYYFHGNQRCDTCTTMEAYAREAIESGFGEGLRNGRIQRRVVNYDEPEHKHFRQDFDLVAPSLVLAAIHEGKQGEWEDLPRIWELKDDKASFLKYVQGELRAFCHSERSEESPLRR